MTKDVLVSIRGTQIMGGEEETLEVITAGTVSEKNGRDYLIFEEAMEGVEGMTRNTIKTAPDRVEVIKRGAVGTRLIFESGKKHKANYQTPLGLIILGVTTRELAVEKGEDSVRIHIEYSLEMNGEFVSVSVLDISAVPRETCSLKLNET